MACRKVQPLPCAAHLLCGAAPLWVPAKGVEQSALSPPRMRYCSDVGLRLGKVSPCPSEERPRGAYLCPTCDHATPATARLIVGSRAEHASGDAIIVGDSNIGWADITTGFGCGGFTNRRRVRSTFAFVELTQPLPTGTSVAKCGWHRNWHHLNAQGAAQVVCACRPGRPGAEPSARAESAPSKQNCPTRPCVSNIGKR